MSLFGGDEAVKHAEALRDHWRSHGTPTPDWNFGLSDDVSTEYVAEDGTVVTLDPATAEANKGYAEIGSEEGTPWLLQDGHWRSAALGGCDI